MKRRSFIKSALAMAVMASPIAALAAKAASTKTHKRGLVYYEDYGDYDNSRNLVTKEYVDAQVIPVHTIQMHNGDVPDGWALCDGQNGTPDLRARFVTVMDYPSMIVPEKPYATIGYIMKIN